MIKVYSFLSDIKRSYLTIAPTNVKTNLLFDYFESCAKEKIPDNITFKVVKGKKNYDLIRLHQAECHYFYSQKLIDVLSQFVDMSDKCYPIKIEGVEEQYYVIYNLPEYPYLNKEKAMFKEEPAFFMGSEITSPLFCITDTYLHIITEDLKNQLVKNKISNIVFTECFVCTEEEYEDWKKTQIKE